MTQTLAYVVVTDCVLFEVSGHVTVQNHSAAMTEFSDCVSVAFADSLYQSCLLDISLRLCATDLQQKIH